jgi:endonuclease YncB( thermonuclease family)
MRRSLPVFVLLASTAYAAPTTTIIAHVESVIDGDTVVATAYPWPDLMVRTKDRLAGIDTPELREACARDRAIAAQKALQALVGEQSIWLTEVEHDKYAGRVVAKVATQSGADVSEALVAKGVAKHWDGNGPKPAWCEPDKDRPKR